jgi:hypothetical protein
VGSVFISYAQKDRDFAGWLTQELQQRLVECTQADITSEGFDASDVFLAILDDVNGFPMASYRVLKLGKPLVMLLPSSDILDALMKFDPELGQQKVIFIISPFDARCDAAKLAEAFTEIAPEKFQLLKSSG